MTEKLSSSSFSSSSSSRPRLSVLVIDDEFDIVNSIKLWLQRHGFNAYGFTDPFLAFEHFQNNSDNIDLVLC
ncbi:MAG TPA: hypothetical protein VIP70_09655, partial [Nitrososphaeraceae archaeon]